ncbi:hypothetical protein COS79_04005 [Candidatus Woesearchaeota archaeon CG06_land_8_20_14_3_00_33_13]|nr:MAG: hypothetical protein COS79_04005 [Candidatus Woesearchaeota archaeon CG06_land_8_20_14_3_00_33_13]
MKESLNKAVEELKRVEHLVFVSLKYTRTADVLKSIIQRTITTFSFGFEAILIYAKEQKLITDFPENLALRCNVLKEIFPDKKELHEYIDYYLKLRKIMRAEYTQREEYRRHVTMSVVIEGEPIDITMDSAKEDFEMLHRFIKYVNEFIFGKPEEEY